jgi:hypothetical protein
MRLWHGVERVGPGREEHDTLPQLLAVEERLQALVRSATQQVADDVAAALAARDAVLADARQAAERADAEQASADRARHDTALAAIETASAGVVREISQIPASRVDALARWALEQAVEADGGPP